MGLLCPGNVSVIYTHSSILSGERHIFSSGIGIGRELNWRNFGLSSQVVVFCSYKGSPTKRAITIIIIVARVILFAILAEVQWDCVLPQTPLFSTLQPASCQLYQPFSTQSWFNTFNSLCFTFTLSHLLFEETTPFQIKLRLSFPPQKTFLMF